MSRQIVAVVRVWTAAACVWMMALAASATATALQAGPSKTATPQPVSVTAGTVINVRLTEAVDVDIAKVGMTVVARVDDPVTVDGYVVVPREARATLQAVKVAQSGDFKGADQLSLKIHSLSIAGRVYQISTDYATVSGKGEGKRTARKVGGGAGLGAVFGGIVGGGSGAAVGAVVGGLAGTAVAASGEEHLRLEAESRLQFTVAAAFRVQP
jgi:hypothetical protein